jgi:decaprenyl-phosphate phosphoribosyltransferase
VISSPSQSEAMPGNPDEAQKSSRGRGKFLVFDLIHLARPRPWAKNVFVLAPLVFSESVVNLNSALRAIAAFACFCLWSGALYGFNDVIDAENDRRHPRKRTRPIPSGRITIVSALTWSATSVAAAVILSLLTLPMPGHFLVFGGLYLANGIAYCLFLKRRVIIDVLSISIGFVIRLLAGCAAIGVDASSWILVCGFALAMLLGFGKRRLELGRLDEPASYRPTLQSYSEEKLNILLGVTSSICLLAYMLYTVSPQTVQLHQTDRLVYTVPFVAYGIFRYLFKVQEARHDGPVEVLLSDHIFALNMLLWSLSVIAVLYGPTFVSWKAR